MSSSPVSLLKPSSWLNLSPPPTHKCLTQFLVVNVVFPLAIYYSAAVFMTDMPALALSAIPPAAEALQQLVAYRLFDPISCVQVLSILLAIAVMWMSNEPKILLLQHSIMTYCFGTATLLSLNWEENLIWRYYREFHGTTDEKRVTMMAQWRDPRVRAMTKTICWVWGLTMLLEGTVRIAFVVIVPVKLMVILSPLLALGFTAIVFLWTYHFAQANGFSTTEIDLAYARPQGTTVYQTI
ncbi:hypothetical protein LEN26_001710 [Aphanomyces euteiches]|nr:hypothetical protein AeMF1_015337 [Aphanomyces euteiches]KAH9160785.1 hypothetical protein LEN26_001710 [Aphanomyces euteiches]KAH9185477.1 hypothetical protein AeNC1_012547 [Aphanomyces euteiches]